MASRGLAAAVAYAVAVAVPVAPALAAAPGDLDPGFGFDSKVTTGISQYGDAAAAAVKADFDGKVVAAGRSGNSFAVVRFNADGTLDTSFGGGDGVVTTSLGAGLEARATGVAIHPDGPIVVVGTVRPPFNLGGQENGDFAAARYDENGNLDTGFGGGDGLVMTDLGENDDAEDAAIQSDGAIVVAGSSGSQGFALVRYEPDGDPDPTFSGDGKQTTNFGAGRSANGRGVAIQPNGSIVVAGFSTSSGGEDDFAVARYLSNGSLDTANFGGGDGLVTTDFSGSNDDGRDVVVQGSGEIVVAGHSDGDFALARYLSNGSLDTANFGGGDGLVTADLGGGSDRANDVAITAGSTILAAGTSGAADEGELPVDGQLALARFTSDGSQDMSFGGGDGEVLTDFGAGTSDGGNGLAVMSGGQIVVAGTASPPFASFEIAPERLQDFILAQYDSSGALDSSFNGDGKAETVVGAGFGDRANAVAVKDDGKIVAVGYSIDEQGPDDPDFAVAVYEPDGDPDTGFSGNGVLTTDLSGQDLFDAAHAVAVQDDGKIVVAGSSNGELAVARYASNGNPDPAFGGGDGWLTTDFGLGLDEGRDIVIQADGSIVVSGGSSSGGLALARYLPGGNPDGTFGGGDGKLTDAFGEGFGSGNGVAIQSSNGAIVVTAHVGHGFGLARYEDDGDPDTSFGGGDGKVTTDFGGASHRTGDLVIQPAGAIVVAGGVGRPDTPVADCGGVAEMDVALARYAANGDPDASFGGGDGKVTTDFGGAVDEGFGLVLQPDGAIAAGGRSNTDFALARYTANGNPDTTFSGDGRVTTDFGTSGCEVALGAARSQGGLLLAGYARDATDSRFALTRYIAIVPPVPTGTVPVVPPPDTSVVATLSARKTQRGLRQKGIVLLAKCLTESCTAEASGFVNVPTGGNASASKRLRLKRVRKSLTPGKQARLKLRFTKAQLTQIRRALRNRGTRNRVVARVTVAATDVAGNRAVQKFRIRLTR